MEMLYEIYFGSINFEVPRTIQDFLFGEAVIEKPQHDLFESEVIEIRDEHKLIAAGIFDNGHNSIAGIMNFFDPAYKKYSLGKYLMLLKMQHAIKNGKAFYYPGYIAYNYKKFDYKLFPNQHLAEIFDAKLKIWLPYSKELIENLAEAFNE
jgi:arginine-tRNA-protein transferase